MIGKRVDGVVQCLCTCTFAPLQRLAQSFPGQSLVPEPLIKQYSTCVGLRRAADLMRNKRSYTLTRTRCSWGTSGPIRQSCTRTRTGSADPHTHPSVGKHNCMIYQSIQHRCRLMKRSIDARERAANTHVFDASLVILVLLIVAKLPHALLQRICSLCCHRCHHGVGIEPCDVSATIKNAR